MIEMLRGAWAFLRQASGDDAYERYLEYRRHNHGDDTPVLSRGEFYRASQHRKWRNVSRCC